VDNGLINPIWGELVSYESI